MENPLTPPRREEEEEEEEEDEEEGGDAVLPPADGDWITQSITVDTVQYRATNWAPGFPGATFVGADTKARVSRWGRLGRGIPSPSEVCDVWEADREEGEPPRSGLMVVCSADVASEIEAMTALSRELVYSPSPFAIVTVHTRPDLCVAGMRAPVLIFFGRPGVEPLGCSLTGIETRAHTATWTFTLHLLKVGDGCLYVQRVTDTSFAFGF